MPTNHGLNWKLEIEQQSEKDWIFWATSPIFIAEIPPAERESCLPKGEVQDMGDEKMDCATRGPINLLECKFNWLIKDE